MGFLYLCIELLVVKNFFSRRCRASYGNFPKFNKFEGVFSWMRRHLFTSSKYRPNRSTLVKIIKIKFEP